MCSFIAWPATSPTACAGCAVRPSRMTAWPSCGGESEETYRAARRNPEAREAGRKLLEDEAKFIDLPRSPLWLNREQVIYAGPEKLT